MDNAYGNRITVMKYGFLADVKNTKANGIINIYPNPATNILTISSTADITSISIANLLGQSIYTNQCNSPEVKIDVASLPFGVYFVKVNGTEVRKFVKQ